MPNNKLALEIAQKLGTEYELRYPTQVNIEAITNKMLEYMDGDACYDILDDLIENILMFEIE